MSQVYSLNRQQYFSPENEQRHIKLNFFPGIESIGETAKQPKSETRTHTSRRETQITQIR